MTKRNQNKEDFDRINEIPDLRIRKELNINDGDVSVVLLNMGGPKTRHDIKDFQERLFNDSRLIRFPLSFLLQKFFAWLMVTLRLKAVEERYSLMKLPEGGSPIYPSTENQLKALKNELFRRGRTIDVQYCFNYSAPLPDEVVKNIKNKNKKYILPLSLYPHYSKATTGSNLFYLQESARKNFPEVKFLPLPSYHLHNDYIQAFVERIYEAIKPGEDLNDFYLLFSAHGLPKYFLMEGDSYAHEIHQTVAKIVNVLKRNERWVVAFQSAVGPFKWLTPYTEKVIESLANQGVKKVLVIPVAFVSDHIETTVEIDIEYKHMANQLGITDFRMTKALENHPKFISALADAVEDILISENNVRKKGQALEPVSF